MSSQRNRQHLSQRDKTRHHRIRGQRRSERSRSKTRSRSRSRNKYKKKAVCRFILQQQECKHKKCRFRHQLNPDEIKFIQPPPQSSDFKYARMIRDINIVLAKNLIEPIDDSAAVMRMIQNNQKDFMKIWENDNKNQT